MRRSLNTLTAAIAASLVACSSLVAQQQTGAQAAGPWWIEVGVKAHSILVDPKLLEVHEVIEAEQRPMGILSPDGSKVAFLGTQPGSARPFDLFVADVDLTQPSGKANIRRLTTDQDRPIAPKWLPGSDAVVFMAGENTAQQVWYVEVAPGHEPERVSRAPLRCYDVSIHGGQIYFLVHKGSKQKQVFKDLMVARSPGLPISASNRGPRAILEDQSIFSYAVSPDGQTIAWGGAGALHFYDLVTKQTREIPLQGVHPQLLNHGAYHIAWRPDGKVLAIYCSFLGGIAMAPDAPPDTPWPRMFAEDKIFFVPANWMPTAEALKVGTTQENFPSPTADDPKAEVSPPAGDESQPWWVRGISQHLLTMKWIDADEGKRRVEAADR